MNMLWGIANPEQLAALKKLLQEYAAERGLAADKIALDDLANSIMNLFNEGITDAAEIRRRLDSRRSAF
jgi:hypothetical protein